MTPEEARGALAGDRISPEDTFRVLRTISALANDSGRQSTARDLVIRALAIRDRIRPDFIPLLDSLVRVVGLIPYADPEQNRSIDDFYVLEAHRAPVPDGDLLFHTLQLQIFHDLLRRRNVVLSATTSVGKSLVVDAVIATGRFRHIAIIVPTIALIDETRRRLGGRFAASHDIITHPSQTPDPHRPAVFVLTQERALARDDLGSVEFFVIDEFYKLIVGDKDPDRAVDLNLIFARLAGQGAQFYLIGPTVGAVVGIAARYNPVFVPSEFSTVALDIVEFNYPDNSDERKDKLIELCSDLESPTLIYCQSPPRASLLAEHLLAHGSFELSEATADAVDWLRREYPGEWILTRALERGLGIHHGNVPRAIQQYMVRAFDAGDIRHIICTSTLIEGINTVAENVIVYDRRVKTTGFDNFTFRNIAGRAGRMRRYFIGKVFVLEAAPADEALSVDVAVGRQDENTPASLILELPEEELTPVSKARVGEIIASSPLSIQTLRLNRHIELGRQYALHDVISRDIVLLEDALVWSGMPQPFQLRMVCELIHDHLDGAALSQYGIKSGKALKAELDRLRVAKTFRSYIDHRLENKSEYQTTSESVEKTLQFMRRYVGYTFPRSLMAISHIQAEVLTRAGRTTVGDYNLLASRAGSLFMNANAFALDEYGVPPETARKLAAAGGDPDTLNDALILAVAALRLPGIDLHPFEREIITDLQKTLSPRQVAK
ncbi:DEAD/DEAH box helicase [Sphingomonas sanguinis]|uniref:DEAD/DEAH box helicase n=1 Tax=Sphingomonas sanguinis TaxID=33051 RepID=UPI000736E8BD|nr:DEAD/DEAH box helicase [Sphingomonas sanguinis]